MYTKTRIHTSKPRGSRVLKWNSTEPDVRASHSGSRMKAPDRVKVTAEGSLAVATAVPVDTARTSPKILT